MVIAGLFLLQLLVVVTSNNRFEVHQPKSLSGTSGDSVTIPCRFTFPDDYRADSVRIYWKINDFHGEFIFNVSEGYTHRDYRGRIKFLGNPMGEKTGHIQISNLRQSDSNRYFCRVAATGSSSEMWQNIPGTHLSVESYRKAGKSPTEPPTESPTSTQANGVAVSNKLQETGIAVGCAVAVLLAIAIVGVIVWRRRKNADPRNKSEPDSKPADKVQTPHSLAATRSTEHDEENNTEGIVYAQLQIGMRNTTKTLPSDQNVLYTAVNFHNESS